MPIRTMALRLDVVHCLVKIKHSKNATFQRLALPPLSEKGEEAYSFMSINLLKPTCYVMHQQFNIQQLYALPTLYLCVLYLSENKQRLVPLTA